MILAMVVPAFNPNFSALIEAIDSILGGVAGHDVCVKIFVIDDGGDEKYVPQYDLVRKVFPDAVIVHRLPINVGPGQARNSGIELADEYNADVIGFLDADDTMADGWYMAVKDYIYDDRYHVITAGYTINGKRRGCTPVVSVVKWVEAPFTRISSIFIKRKVFSYNVERLLSTRAGEDTEFIIRLLLRYPFVHIPCSVSQYKCAYKEHFIYPHPLTASLRAYADEDNPEVFQLKQFVRKRDEFMGLITRQIFPSSGLTFYSFPRAFFLYCFGRVYRRVWAVYKSMFNGF
jgi:glycosyltransferase involved in cell wall biosynthesis